MKHIDSVDHLTSKTGASSILQQTNQRSDRWTEISTPLSISLSPTNDKVDVFEGFEAICREYNILQHAIRPVRQEAMSEASIASDDKSLSSSFLAVSDSAEFNVYDQVFSDLLRGRSSSNTSTPKSIILANLLRSQTYLATQINSVTRHEDIFDLLDLANHQKITERLRYLHEITQDDDPEDPAMKLLSLRELALFFTGDGNSLPYPQIGISPNGSLQAEWRSRKASAVMKFLTDGNTRFAGTTGNQDGRQTIQGSGTKKHALQSILPFINDSCR